MKRCGWLFIFLISLLLVGSGNSFEVYAETGYTFESQKCTYTVTKEPYYVGYDMIPGNVTLVSFNNKDYLYKVTIPSTVTAPNGDKYYVNEIGPFAFAGSNFSSIELGSRITTMGEGAFASCTNMTQFTIPSMCDSLGAACFYNCLSLNRIEIPPSVLSIGDGCFSYCYALDKLTVNSGNPYYTICDNMLMNYYRNHIVYAYKASGKLMLSEDITSIAQYAFEGNKTVTSITCNGAIETIERGTFCGCTGLKNIGIDGVTEIRKDAFCGCESLTSITIPATVKTIQGNPFGYCNSLKEIVVDPANANYSSKDGMLLNKKGNALISGNALKGVIVIDASIKTINEYAFHGNCQITCVTIPATVKNILDYAFYGCQNLVRARFASRKAVYSGKDYFKNSYYFIEISVPYSTKAWADGSIELQLLENCPDGAIITNWTK